MTSSQVSSLHDFFTRFPWFVTDRSPETVRLVREIRGRRLGDHAPASTFLVVAGLASPAFKVEIEAEAVAGP